MWCAVSCCLMEAADKKKDQVIVSPSLLCWDPRKYAYHPAFVLGVGEEWLPKHPLASDDDDDAEFWQSIGAIEDSEWIDVSTSKQLAPPLEEPAAPKPKRCKVGLAKLSLSLKKPHKAPLKDNTNFSAQPKAQHFSKPISSPEQEKAGKGLVPQSTEASTQWALRNFNDWASYHCSLTPDDPMPGNLLASHNANLVCKWLCRFLLETRKTDGSLYPPSSLRSLICGLNRILQSNEAPFSVVDKGDPQFRPLLKTLDSLSSELHHSGVGVTKNSAKVIELEHESILWEKGLLGMSTPKVLQCTVFFYVGLNFVLRGVQEQYDLIPSQFVRVSQDVQKYDESVYYEYREYISKKNQHQFKDINSKNKTVKAFALPGNNCCVIKLLDKYLSLLPSDAPYFYMRAKDKAPPNPSVSSFANQRVGINVLKNMLPELSEKAGIQVRYTNHSLQATAITRMFNGEVDEKVIAETSGHKSLKALRSYEHTCKQKLQNVSRVINEIRNTDSTGTGNKCLLPEALEKEQTIKDEEQTTSTECKDGGVKEEKVTGDEDKQDVKSLHPNQAFSGTFSNCTINISWK